jgi:glycosyltransferase involved in cell wall biosynthesis
MDSAKELVSNIDCRAPTVSVVVPMLDEAENISPLTTSILHVLAPFCRFEVVLVDDGSKDQTRAIALDLAGRFEGVRVIGHDSPAGQSAAIHSGVLAARAAIIATLDADGQNPPENLTRILAPFLAAHPPGRLGLVAGQRVGRKDSYSKLLASRFANKIRSVVLQDGTRDTGCGLKAFRKDAYMALPFFNHQHRYLPALFSRDGWQVAHVDVTHAPRLHGRSKYGNLGRALVGITDLAGVAWLIRRRKTATPREFNVLSEPALPTDEVKTAALSCEEAR